MYFSDSYKANDNNVMMMQMSKPYDSQSSVINTGTNPTNPAQLFMFVAEFISKGDQETARALFRALHK